MMVTSDKKVINNYNYFHISCAGEGSIWYARLWGVHVQRAAQSVGKPGASAPLHARGTP